MKTTSNSRWARQLLPIAALLTALLFILAGSFALLNRHVDTTPGGAVALNQPAKPITNQVAPDVTPAQSGVTETPRAAPAPVVTNAPILSPQLAVAAPKALVSHKARVWRMRRVKARPQVAATTPLAVPANSLAIPSSRLNSTVESSTEAPAQLPLTALVVREAEVSVPTAIGPTAPVLLQVPVDMAPSHLGASSDLAAQVSPAPIASTAAEPRQQLSAIERPDLPTAPTISASAEPSLNVVATRAPDVQASLVDSVLSGNSQLAALQAQRADRVPLMSASQFVPLTDDELAKVDQTNGTGVAIVSRSASGR